MKKVKVELAQNSYEIYIGTGFKGMVAILIIVAVKPRIKLLISGFNTQRFSKGYRLVANLPPGKGINQRGSKITKCPIQNIVAIGINTRRGFTVKEHPYDKFPFRHRMGHPEAINYTRPFDSFDDCIDIFCD